MNSTILGIGPLEVLFIGLLILIVFGPERLPEFARGLGRALRRLREAYTALTYEYRDDLRPVVEELQEVTRELQAEIEAIRQAADLRPVLEEQSNAISQAVTLAPTPNGAAITPAAGDTPTEPLPNAAPSLSNGGAHSLISLPADNPWSNLGVAVRSDTLDEDNPWRA